MTKGIFVSFISLFRLRIQQSRAKQRRKKKKSCRENVINRSSHESAEKKKVHFVPAVARDCSQVIL